jgi:hypothetical protein
MWDMSEAEEGTTVVVEPAAAVVVVDDDAVVVDDVFVWPVVSSSPSTRLGCQTAQFSTVPSCVFKTSTSKLIH